jgi:hypothetical protein
MDTLEVTRRNVFVNQRTRDTETRCRFRRRDQEPFTCVGRRASDVAVLDANEFKVERSVLSATDETHRDWQGPLYVCFCIAESSSLSRI